MVWSAYQDARPFPDLPAALLAASQDRHGNLLLDVSDDDGTVYRLRVADRPNPNDDLGGELEQVATILEWSPASRLPASTRLIRIVNLDGSKTQTDDAHEAREAGTWLLTYGWMPPVSQYAVRVDKGEGGQHTYILLPILEGATPWAELVRAVLLTPLAMAFDAVTLPFQLYLFWQLRDARLR